MDDLVERLAQCLNDWTEKALDTHKRFDTREMSQAALDFLRAEGALVEPFTVSYDESADTLYVNKRQDVAYHSVEGYAGIVRRYDSQGDFIGATVMDFAHLPKPPEEG